MWERDVIRRWSRARGPFMMVVSMREKWNTRSSEMFEEIYILLDRGRTKNILDYYIGNGENRDIDLS